MISSDIFTMVIKRNTDILAIAITMGNKPSSDSDFVSSTGSHESGAILLAFK